MHLSPLTRSDRLYSRYYRWRHRYPFIIILAAFACGITLSFYQKGTYYGIACLIGAVAWLAWLAFTAMPTAYTVGKRYTLLKDAIGIVALIVSGYAYFHYQMPQPNPLHFSHHLEQIEAYQGVVIGDVMRKKRFYATIMAIKRVRIRGVWHEAWGRIRLSGFGGSIKYGDLLEIEGSPQEVRGRMNPHTFNYQLFLLSKGIHHQHHLGKSQCKKIKSDAGNGFLTAFYKLRQWSGKQLKVHFDNSDVRGILMAMVLGDRSGVGASLRQTYSSMGVMHLVAISGLHIGLLYMILRWLIHLMTSWAERRKKYNAFILPFLWGYALLTGLSPSVLRAVSMLTLVHIGQSLRRDITLGNLLPATAFLMLLYQPFLLFHVGFQLSFTAVWGILSFYRPLYKSCTFEDYLARRLWQVTSCSLAAQLGTFPLTLYYFHAFPTYFLLGNGLMVPLATYLLGSGLGIIVCSSFPFLSGGLAYCVEVLLDSTHGLLHYLSTLPYATLGPFFLPIGCVGLLYASLVTFHMSLSGGKIYRLLTLLLLSSIVGWGIVHHYQQGRQHQIIFYSVAPHQVIGFIKGRRALIFMQGGLRTHHFIYEREVMPSLQAMGITQRAWCRWEDIREGRRLSCEDDNGLSIIEWGGKRIAFMREGMMIADSEGLDASEKKRIDFLVVKGPNIEEVPSVLERWGVGEIIVVGPVPPETCSGLTVHFLDQEGAYVVPICGE